MSKSRRPVKRLKGDPARVAVPSLEGYAYQIWWSIYEWLKLADDEALYLEGAEDFDLLRSADAKAVQVKHSGHRISLSSKEVLDTIANFWATRMRNPEFRLSMRLLTTAERTTEKKKPFGARRGLDYWDDCAAGAPVDPIARFLKSKNSLPRDLREFVEQADAETIREQLIRRIQWDTGREARPQLQELVAKRLISYGERVHNTPPNESKKIVPVLLQYVWDVACSTDRYLTRADFNTLFEEALPSVPTCLRHSAP